MSGQTTKTWDQYTAEAELEPFRLKVSEDETIVFTTPSAQALLRIAEGLRTGDLEVILSNIAGEAWPRLTELFGGTGHKALPALTEDLMDHFDLYEEVTLIGPGGGSVKRKRPRQIQMLLEQGYRPAGEARASRG